MVSLYEVTHFLVGRNVHLKWYSVVVVYSAQYMVVSLAVILYDRLTTRFRSQTSLARLDALIATGLIHDPSPSLVPADAHCLSRK